MMTKALAVVLAALLLPVPSTANVLAATNDERQVVKKAELTAKVKRAVAGLGVGKDARIAVKTRDKTKVIGYVSDVDDASFTVVSLESGAARTVQYGDVATVQGNNLATGWKIAIGIGIGVGIFFAVIAVILSQSD